MKRLLRLCAYWFAMPVGILLICLPAFAQSNDHQGLTTHNWITIVLGLATFLVGLWTKGVERQHEQLSKRFDELAKVVDADKAKGEAFEKYVLTTYHDNREIEKITQPIVAALATNTAATQTMSTQVIRLQERFDASGIGRRKPDSNG